MSRRLYTFLLLLLATAACQTTPAAVSGPTAIPFPTMTPGQVIRAPMPTAVGVSPNGSGLANAATAIALANRPTPTPNYAACPPIASPALGEKPAGAREMADAIISFLAHGGAPATLETGLRDHWNVLGSGGLVRADLDLTGEGTPEILVTFQSPDNQGILLITGCADGRYSAFYQSAADGETPQIIEIGDMNHDTTPEVMYATPKCASDQTCTYQTQLITWRPNLGRFISLLGGAITSDELPTVGDPDNDQVIEIVVRYDNPGTADTGPLRTGSTLYDWNGVGYVQSVTQLDPPRFRIQVIQEADSAFSQLNMDQAVPLYQLALSDNSLRAWLNDEGPALQSYVTYRLVLAYAYTENDKLLDTYQGLIQTFPDGATAPVYVALATTFWNAFQVTHNLRSACLEVQDIIRTRPEALDLLNRYGSRSPTYTIADLCPF